MEKARCKARSNVDDDMNELRILGVRGRMDGGWRQAQAVQSGAVDDGGEGGEGARAET